MKDSFIALNNDVANITMVVDKLMTKQNVSVFEKICENCSKTFESFNRYSVQDIVECGCVSEALDFLNKLLVQVKRLKQYKESLIAYLDLQEMQSASNIQNLQTGINGSSNNISNSNAQSMNNVKQLVLDPTASKFDNGNAA